MNESELQGNTREPLPDLWFVELIQDGEYTGQGDNPPGYAGDWEEWPNVVDINGNKICECDDVDQAKEIVDMHNSYRDLVDACELVPPLLREIRGFSCDVFGGESNLTDCLDSVLAKIEAAIDQAGI